MSHRLRSSSFFSPNLNTSGTLPGGSLSLQKIFTRVFAAVLNAFRGTDPPGYAPDRRHLQTAPNCTTRSGLYGYYVALKIASFDPLKNFSLHH
jgi:hypothetical protein